MDIYLLGPCFVELLYHRIYIFGFYKEFYLFIHYIYIMDIMDLFLFSYTFILLGQ